MKTKINIEQFDNGITLKVEDMDGAVDPTAMVVLDRDIMEAIGKSVWGDAQCVMNAAAENVVEIIIETKVIKQ